MNWYYRGACRNEHDIAISNEVKRLENLGYHCEREHKISLGRGKNGRELRVVVDIYAKRRNEELLIEVGQLSNSHGPRLELLKKLSPNAKIIHITQWKNWIPQDEWENAFFEWRFRKLLKLSNRDVIIHEMEEVEGS